jgi:4-hydroxybenzoate polyprenyltransferase
MTILQTVEIVEKTWGWDWLGFAIGVLAIFLMIAFFFFDADGDAAMATLALIFCTVLFIVSGFIFSHAKEKDRYNKYQVLLDDSVSVNELYENYEVIEQEGITFWVEDKRDDE